MAESIEVVCLYGLSNDNRFGRILSMMPQHPIGDPRLAFYLPQTTNFPDGVFWVRLKAKDRAMKWYEDSPEDPQTNDVRAIIKGNKPYVIHRIGGIKVPELDLEEFKQKERLRNQLRGFTKRTIDQYFAETITRAKLQFK